MNNEICWALINLMDGVQRHELPEQGFSEEDCDRIWNATLIAKAYYESWLDTPNFALGGKKPSELLETSNGLNIVMNEIQTSDECGPL